MAEEITEDQIFEDLKAVIDPELFVNIIDLGLVYDLKLEKNPLKVDITMTLTSRGCPMGDAIMQDINETLVRLHPGIGVNIDLVWEPAWSIEFVSEEGKEELGYY